MPGLSAVLDTNILISLAFAQRGIAKTLRELLAEDAFTLVTSALQHDIHLGWHLERLKILQRPLSSAPDQSQREKPGAGYAALAPVCAD